jgi:hypothetical protein
MTDQSPTDPARLPHPPEAILGLLRRAEASLDDLDAVRAEIRAVREALESAEEPELATVAAAVALSGEGTLTVSVSITASGSGSGNTERTGTAIGQMPPEPESSVWLEKAKSYGPAGLALADFLLRVYQTFK